MRPVSVSEVRRRAQQRLPKVIFDLIDGGAGDEVTLRANRDGFDAYRFVPRGLVDVAERDSAVDVFGQRISLPVMLAPTGAGRLLHERAELEVARAAHNAGTVYVQSSTCSYPLEEVAQASGRTAWFQLYVPPTRGELKELVGRVKDAGFAALAVAIDTPVFGGRERDVRNGFSIPFKLQPRHAWDAVRKPKWAFEFLRGNVGPGLAKTCDGGARPSLGQTGASVLASAYPVTWDDITAVRELWSGPLLVKGVMGGHDCERLIEGAGVDGIMVSNHGGRQLDGARSTIEVLPEVVEAVAGRAAVFLDGGVRRGGDVLKALALGARGVLVGRPYLYGLAWAGGRGVSRVLEIYRTEIDRDMALLGCRSPSEIDDSLVQWAR